MRGKGTMRTIDGTTLVDKPAVAPGGDRKDSRPLYSFIFSLLPMLIPI